MKTIIETVVDKSKWQEGPWQTEPDKKQWLDEETGYPCLIVRQPTLGHLCGYVGVPSSHPWFGHEPDASVHGGVTYGAKCNNHICHEVEEGEDDNIWWIGFDAAHYDDRSMLTEMYKEILGPDTWGAYKGLAYMENECRSLAQQAKEAANGK